MKIDDKVKERSKIKQLVENLTVENLKKVCIDLQLEVNKLEKENFRLRQYKSIINKLSCNFNMIDFDNINITKDTNNHEVY